MCATSQRQHSPEIGPGCLSSGQAHRDRLSRDSAADVLNESTHDAFLPRMNMGLGEFSGACSRTRAVADYGVLEADGTLALRDKK